ncbi:MAG: MATE family efflux transporter [Firmicutes bacterium]|nr:MATE family efflux transporter [Bacillota bacterium]
MAAHVKDMTQGRPGSLIISFALPLMLGNVFQQLYTVVDTMVVGKALGVSALAAVGAADWLNWMMLGIVQGLTQGFAILMAQRFGAKEEEKLRQTVGLSAVLSVLSALVLMLIGQLAVDPVLQAMNTPAEIHGSAELYLRIMFSGIPVVMTYNLLACILRSLGDGKTPLNAMIVASIINVVLDIVFVLILHWGIAGAAIATLIAQVFSGLFCFWKLRQIKMLRMNRSHFKWDGGRAITLFKLGIPMAFQNAIISIGGMLVQTVVNGLGVLYIAGFTATNKLYGILEIAASSYGYAMITYVGQNLGAKKIDRIRKGQRAAIVVAISTSLVIAAFMILFGKHILSMFISGTPEEVTQTLRIAYYYLVIMSLFLPVLYVLHVTRSTIQGMGNTVLPMASGIGEFVMRTGAALLLPLLAGDTGIFYAEILAWIGADIILIPSYYYVISKVNR